MGSLAPAKPEVLHASAALFNTALFRTLANRGDSRRLDDAVARYMTLSQSKARTNARVLQSAFGRLTRDYPVEYVYRNVITRQLFLDRHNEHDTCLHELRIKDSIADVVILNGHGDVYEVKSAYDSPAKLGTQIRDYYRAFTRVNVVVPQSNIARFLTRLPSRDVGLLAYDGRRVETVREAVPDASRLETQTLFDLLRVAEAQTVLTNMYGEAPDVPNVFRYRVWLDLAEQAPVERFQTQVQEVLKSRQVRVFHRLRSIQGGKALAAAMVQLNPDVRGYDRCTAWLREEPVVCTTPTCEENNTSY